ncbi:putative disease resistance protein RGA4 isoform X2 [Papaver somniferum]|nr:putative disease resistance protein RGA4 isoform X2 [Papaver somniferum]
MIEAVTSDAETKQVKDAAVRLWLRRLKDVVYDANNILDELSYEAIRRYEKNCKKDKVRKFLSSSNPLAFRVKMSNKIKDINKNLDGISSHMAKFHLEGISSTSDDEHDQYIEQQNRLTASHVDELRIFGRENDKLEIVKMLMTVHTSLSSSVYSSQHEKVSVVSIVGMGGLGKTTLAQLVYQDVSIVRNFEPRMWVCVADVFDIKKILMNIIESITERKCEDVSNVVVLVSKVQEMLRSKKYLLVLDDLWNENAEDWEKLRGMLHVGAYGSKILVTTRSDKVASIVRGIVPPYDLKTLHEEECWSIIKNRTFSPGGAFETASMTSIGQQISRKCAGLPLAAKFLGSLMFLNRDERDWLRIRDNDVFNETEGHSKIMSVLKLSYDNLSSQLKQCFSYCALFPKNWVIDRETLIQLWMAEGFLQPSSRVSRRSIEDVGNDYFQCLLSSSFFHNVVRDQLGDILTCKMHDLVHDLAQSVVGVHETTTLCASRLENISEIRRLRLVLDEEASKIFSKVLSKARKLQTIFSMENENSGTGVTSLFSSNCCLRVVCLLGAEETPSIMSSTLTFKHLRYLNLSFCMIEVTSNQLYHLQTLVLSRCQNVHKILKDIGSLRNLRHLSLWFSDAQVLPDSIVRLTNLQKLDLSNCCSLEALPLNIGSLKHLRSLDVRGTSITALPDSLTCIENLRWLNFEDCWSLKSLPQDFGALTRLRCLKVRGTSIKVLPESCINSLCNLEIVELGSECELPMEIKNWPKLRQLFLPSPGYSDDADRMIMPRGIERLTCLEELRSYFVRKEEVCSGIEDLVCLNSLKVLEIRNLENVRGKIDAQKGKLKDKQNIQGLFLYWSSCGDGTSMLNDEMVLKGLQPHSNLKELRIDGFGGLTLPKWICSPYCLPHLVELYIVNCFCERLPALGLLPCLRVLELYQFYSLKSLGDEFYYQGSSQRDEESGSSTENFTVTTATTLFPSLTYFGILNMCALEEWVDSPPTCISFPSLKRLCIDGCERLRTTPSSFSSLEALELKSTNSRILSSILNSRGGGLASLTSIDIYFSPELICFPLGVLQNSTHLHSLRIYGCINFQGFRPQDGSEVVLLSASPEVNGTAFSSSLHLLQLEDCSVLTYLPDLRLCTSLRELYIKGCNKLKNAIPYDLSSLTFVKDLQVHFVEEYDGCKELESRSRMIMEMTGMR